MRRFISLGLGLNIIQIMTECNGENIYELKYGMFHSMRQSQVKRNLFYLSKKSKCSLHFTVENTTLLELFWHELTWSLKLQTPDYAEGSLKLSRSFHVLINTVWKTTLLWKKKRMLNIVLNITVIGLENLPDWQMQMSVADAIITGMGQ